MRVYDLADDDVVVALLDDAGDLALDRGRCRVEYRYAGRALMNRLTRELAVFELGRLEEGESDAFPVLAEHVQREGFGLLDDAVGAGVGLDADHDERRVEGGLRHPIDRGSGD